MIKHNLPTVPVRDITPGLRVRVYNTSFCRPKPDDLYEDQYYEGVIIKHEPILSYITRAWYIIDKVVIEGKEAPHSWLIGRQADFAFNERNPSDTHYVFNLSNQTQLIAHGQKP